MTKHKITNKLRLLQIGILLILVGFISIWIWQPPFSPQIKSEPSLIIAPSVVAETPTPTIAPTPTHLQTIQVYITFYGWPDNTPSGRAIAYPKSRFKNALHDIAGGTGTFKDPLTFAASPDLFSVGTKIYVPYLKKYIIKEDLCASCGVEPLPHLDIWMESDGSYPLELEQCQRKFTRQNIPVEIDPPPGRPVNPKALFDQSSGECLN